MLSDSYRELQPLNGSDCNPVIAVSSKGENGKWNDLGKTELIKYLAHKDCSNSSRNQRHPVFRTITPIKFLPNESQTLRFTCYDIKDEEQLKNMKTEFKIGSAVSNSFSYPMSFLNIIRKQSCQILCFLQKESLLQI